MAAPGYQKNYNLWRDLRSPEQGIGSRFLAYVCTPADVLLARNLGERNFEAIGLAANFFFWAGAFFGLWFLAQMIDAWVPLPFVDLRNLFAPWVLAFVAVEVVAGLIQLWSQLQNVRQHDRERPHSYSLGQPSIPLYKWLPISENVQLKLLNPALVLLLGAIVIANLDWLFGAYIVITGFFMLVRSWAVWQEQRGLVLDSHDARRFAVALAQWQAEESAFGSTMMKPVLVTPAFPSRLYKRETVTPVVTSNGTEPREYTRTAPLTA